MVKCGVRDDACREHTGDKNKHKVRRADVEIRVVFECRHVEVFLWCENPGDIVHVPKAIVVGRVAHWQVSEVPNLKTRVRIRTVEGGGCKYIVVVHDWEDDPPEEDETNEDMDLGPPRHHKW